MSPQLRILSGPQAGARISLPQGNTVIGGSEHCDIMVSGLGATNPVAEIEVSEDALVLRVHRRRAISDEVELVQTLAIDLGQGFLLGDLWMCLDLESAPWPEHGSWNSSLTDSAAVELLVSTSVAGEEINPNGSDMAPARGGRPRASQRLILCAIVLSLVVGGTATTWALAPISVRSSGMAPLPSAIADNKSLHPSYDIVSRILRDTPYGERLRFNHNERNEAELSGFLPDQATIDALRGQLQSAGVYVALNVQSDADLLGRLNRFLADKAYPVTSLTLANGELTATIKSGDSAFAKRIEYEIGAVFPDIRRISVAVTNTNDISGVLERLLEKHQLSHQIDASVDGGEIRLSGDLGGRALRRLEEMLLEIDAMYGNRVKLTVSVVPPQERLPFVIRQVVGGAQPYIVTTENHRIYEGGEKAGFRLISLRDRKAVFGGAKRVEFDW